MSIHEPASQVRPTYAPSAAPCHTHQQPNQRDRDRNKMLGAQCGNVHMLPYHQAKNIPAYEARIANAPATWPPLPRLHAAPAVLGALVRPRDTLGYPPLLFFYFVVTLHISLVCTIARIPATSYLEQRATIDVDCSHSRLQSPATTNIHTLVILHSA
ncbi:hypothetical protein D9619_003294 [Psilocybe cf. subviscida]|uniref:Uncharacterized protein n=1 Tax=Psilocybe cf. subviscida TaxID=2480587 RepID=A0A8H5AWJ2_9AGAR|nr:hypothetical protein D9619_003294 [Psilocybe cf. subviscida]